MSRPKTLRSPAGGNELQAAAQIARERFPELSPRQAETLVLLAEGRSNASIGACLEIEERTAEAHVAGILEKLGAENRTAAATHYLRQVAAPPAPPPAPPEKPRRAAAPPRKPSAKPRAPRRRPHR